MRLLDTSSLTFKADFTGEIPPYAILSHRWSQDSSDPEITYQQFLTGDCQYDSASFQKILRFCTLAAANGLQWAWIDTCCINKESSAELTEAINSMYQWYYNAQECYAFLEDVIMPEAQISGRRKLDFVQQAFSRSVWFTRGWTLQELLACPNMSFYDHHGAKIGTRLELCGVISNVTNIDMEYLDKRQPITNASVAKRMSWAARRQTTRIEDRAYSLLGIFDVNMPLLYGEGTKAFQRLQLAIIQQSNDQSIFAWGIDDKSIVSPFGVLAQSPSDFFNSKDVVPVMNLVAGVQEPNQITNEGIAHFSRITLGDFVREFSDLRYWRLVAQTYVSVFFAGRTERRWERSPRWTSPAVKGIRELKSCHVQLPCILRQPSGKSVSLVLFLEPEYWVHRLTFKRVAMQSKRGSLIESILYSFNIGDRKLYLTYNQAHNQTNFHVTSLPETDVLKILMGGSHTYGRMYLALVVLMVYMFFQMHDCNCQPVTTDRIPQPPMFVFGLLMCIRQIAGRNMAVVLDTTILWFGYFVWLQCGQECMQDTNAIT